MPKPKTTPAAPAPRQEIPLGARVIFLALPQRLDEQAMRAALTALDEHDPRWLTMQQLIAEEMSAATMDFSAPDVSDSKRAHGAGQVDALSRLLSRLLNLRRET